MIVKINSRNFLKRILSRKYFMVLFFILVFLMGSISHRFLFEKNSVDFNQIRENSSVYKYINPLLIISGSENVYDELNPLKNKIKKYSDNRISNGDAINVSVYFREMNSGRSTGVREDEFYSPSSMLKIASMIAFLKKASDNPNIFDELEYYKYVDTGQFYKPLPLKEGYYSKLALLQQMVVYSDNSAMDLINKANIKDILKLYDELQLEEPIGSPDDFMSPREYSRFFRILYNSTYLSRSYSEQALKLLAFSEFKNGINQGVPNNIVVSHKFGEETVKSKDGIEYRELHDCGIVYYPKDPYFLCIMTKGKDFEKLADIIKSISSIVYDYHSKNNLN